MFPDFAQEVMENIFRDVAEVEVYMGLAIWHGNGFV
jgi:hypothetical protein